MLTFEEVEELSCVNLLLQTYVLNAQRKCQMIYIWTFPADPSTE